jgi:hypothetical protein
MQPVKVQSYSEFVEMFGETVPGGGSSDVVRNGNFQSPMYGTYAAKAFLRSNVAPLTYVRLLGQQDSNATAGSAGIAGWQTFKVTPAAIGSENGGAFGLWLFKSSSVSYAVTPESASDLGTGRLAAVWYLNKTSSIQLSGTLFRTASSNNSQSSGVGKVIISDTNYNHRVILSSSTRGTKNYTFNFDDTSAGFVRKVFNTNPQLASEPGAFYPASVAENYWLGETYEQELRRRSLHNSMTYGVILPIAKNSDSTIGPQAMRRASNEAVAGWFIGQDLNDTASFAPQAQQKLFRLKGRGHGEWLHKNCKVSIANIRKSTTTVSDYGTFSVIIRALSDTDNNVQVMERFDNLTLNPASPNFISRIIGDQYQQWDSTNKMLKNYGDYPNRSKFVYVETTSDVQEGTTKSNTLLPFGYFGPPKFKTTGVITGSSTDTAIDNTYIYFPDAGLLNSNAAAILSGAASYGDGVDPAAVSGALSGTLAFPDTLLRLSASDGGLSDPKRAYFGIQTTRTAQSTVNDSSIPDYLRLLTADFPGDPTNYSGSTQHPSALPGIAAWSYMFSMDDLVKTSGGQYYWLSGTRAAGNGHAYSTTLTDGYRQFTAPFWGGFDGFDLLKPDPMYNGGMTEGTSTELNDYIYYTWKRAMDTCADPEFVDINMMVSPGLTLESLTAHEVNLCGDRADSLAIIDLPSVYIPGHEAYKSSKPDRIGTTPENAATALKDRQIDSSYGCTFYPWVQTRDEKTSRLLWIPPSVAMMGVFASSQAKSELWFAPAGFNRGGLSEGAAGIPITGITERLTSKNRDTLYESNINPIASFPSTGIVVFGQKTLQEQQSALDRINVRRLVIFMKKQISILASQILFEQNVQSTWNRFIGLIDPFLSNIKSRFGITDYRLILDESTTTPDLIDQNVLYAKIMVKPARAIEFIAIDFVIMSTGASFDD